MTTDKPNVSRIVELKRALNKQCHSLTKEERTDLLHYLSSQQRKIERLKRRNP